MSHEVFICYSARDKTVANAICAVLEAEGVRCWMAPRDILPGADWGESIIDAINDARAMVLVFSSNANEAQSQIKREVERAVNKGIPVIPLRIENVMPTKALEYFLSTPHWLDAFTPPLDDHVRQLAYSIKQLLGKQAGEKPNLTAMPPPPLRSAMHLNAGKARDEEEGILAWVKQPLHAGMVAAAVVVIAVALWWFLRAGATPEDQQAWNVAATEDTIPGYALYMRQEPQGYYLSHAQSRSAELKSDVDQAFAKAKAANTAAAYQAFMQTYAKEDVDMEEAQQAYANAEAQEAAARTAYQRAVATHSRDGYQSFIAGYGGSSYAGEVRSRLAACHTETQTGGSTQTNQLQRNGTGSAGNSQEACNDAHASAMNSLQSECSASQGKLGQTRVLSENAQQGSSAVGQAAGSILGNALFGAGRSVNLGSSYQCTTSIEASCEVTSSSSRQVDVCP
jgi:hypothetical protein